MHIIFFRTLVLTPVLTPNTHTHTHLSYTHTHVHVTCAYILSGASQLSRLRGLQFFTAPIGGNTEASYGATPPSGCKFGNGDNLTSFFESAVVAPLPSALAAARATFIISRKLCGNVVVESLMVAVTEVVVVPSRAVVVSSSVAVQIVRGANIQGGHSPQQTPGGHSNLLTLHDPEPSIHWRRPQYCLGSATKYLTSKSAGSSAAVGWACINSSIAGTFNFSAAMYKAAHNGSPVSRAN